MAIFAILTLVAVSALVWAVLIERHLYAVREESVAVLPKGSEDIRVLQIGDIHLAPWQRRKMRWIAGLAAVVKPDLVVNTGDNLGHRNAVGELLDCVEPLCRLPGVFVNGSNDYRAPGFTNPFTYFAAPTKARDTAALDTAGLVTGLEAHGWLNLNNAGGSLTIKGSPIAFIGLDDEHIGRAHLSSIEDSASARTGAVTLTIGVTHAPYRDAIEAMGRAGVDVLFAGHTHGGQVCLPGYGALVTNCDLPTKQAKGLSIQKVDERSIWLNVVAGLGTSIFAPVRFFCRPEVRVLTLVARD